MDCLTRRCRPTSGAQWVRLVATWLTHRSRLSAKAVRPPKQDDAKQSMTGRQFLSSTWKARGSRLAIGLGVIHFLAFLLIIFSRPLLPTPSSIPCGPVQPGEACLDPWSFWGFYVAGRYFHNSLDFRLLALGDLPTLIIVDSFMSLSAWFSIPMSRLTETYVAAAVWLVFGTAQWWLIGSLLNAAVLRQRPNTTLQPPSRA
jgi:hypothetical protein